MIELERQTTPPAAPADGLRIFARGIGDVAMLTSLSPAARQAFLNRATAGARRVSIRPTAGGIATARANSEVSITPGSTASVAAAIAGSANVLDRYTRARLTGTTALNVSAGLFPCSAAPGYGVFRRREGFIARWVGGIRTAETAGIASMVGVYAPPIVVADPPDMPNHFHVSLGVADATGDGWSFRRRTGTGAVQRTILGLPRGNNTGFAVWIWAAPNAGPMGLVVQNLQTGAIVHDASYTTDLPDPDTLLIFEAVASSRSTGVAQIHDFIGIDLLWW
jgi:hypothetical protein